MRESLHLSLEQKRAKIAWDSVKKVDKNKKEYRALARKLPAMIMVSGLGQTLAFLKSKGENENAEQLIYNHLSNWLAKESPIDWGSEISELDLLYKVINVDIATYRQATQEALLFLSWLKRAAEAEIKEGK
jgi:CRISPR-associated protein Cmr5